MKIEEEQETPTSSLKDTKEEFRSLNDWEVTAPNYSEDAVVLENKVLEALEY